MNHPVLEQHNLTFPRTPFQVFRVHDTEYGNSGRRYHIYVAGEWNSWEKTIRECSLRLAELKLQYDDYPRPNIDLAGWQEINRVRGELSWAGCPNLDAYLEAVSTEEEELGWGNEEKGWV